MSYKPLKVLEKTKQQEIPDGKMYISWLSINIYLKSLLHTEISMNRVMTTEDQLVNLFLGYPVKLGENHVESVGV